MDNNTEQLKVLAEVFNTDKIVTSDQIEQVLEAILNILVRFKKENQSLNDDTKTQVKSIIDGISREHDRILASVEKSTQSIKSEATEAVEKALERLREITKEVLSYKAKDGESPDQEKIIEEVLTKIKLPEYEIFSLEEKGENIVSEINALPTNEDEYKIDASHIKNLPTPRGGYSPTVLGNAADLNQSARADGYAIVWDDTNKNFKFSASGGGGGNIISINADTTVAQLLVTGTAGTDFAIADNGTGTHTFNLPTASATNRGALSSSDWSTFNAKQGAITLTTTGSSGAATLIGNTLNIPQYSGGGGTPGGSDTQLQWNNAGVFGGISGATTNGTTVTFTTGNLVGADVKAASSAGLQLLSSAGTVTALFGAGGGANSTFYGGSKFDYATATTVPYFDASKNLISSAVTPTELGYLSGVTSAIQTQINAKGAGTVTSVGWTGGIVSIATATTTPSLTVAGTSGGVPYFSSASTWASSAALAANALVIGGGAGAAPSTITTGTGVVTALGVNVGSAGAFVVNGGALGTPSSGTVTNLTGTASININGTVGATTPSTGVFTTLVAGSTTSLLLGTAGSAVGNIGFRNATSGTATLQPPTGALGTYSVTLPNAASTLPIFGQQITFAGPTAARTVTLPDANITVARTDAANTFTGVQTFSTPIATGSVATMTATVGGGVPTPPNNTTTFLRGDGTFATPTATVSFNGARVYKSSGQSIGTTLTALSFDTESFDTNTYHDNATNNSRLTVPTTGYYRITGLVTSDANATTRAQIRVNGTTVIAAIGGSNIGASTQNGAFIETVYSLTAADYIELLGAFGSTQNTTSGISGTVFEIQFLGA